MFSGETGLTTLHRPRQAGRRGRGLLAAGVGRRRREKVAHPVGVMEVAAAVAFGLAGVSERCRSLLRAAPAEVRQSWGAREEWVRGDAPAKTPWRNGPMYGSL